jgi:hypothetical protein
VRRRAIDYADAQYLLGLIGVLEAGIRTPRPASSQKPDQGLARSSRRRSRRPRQAVSSASRTCPTSRWPESPTPSAVTTRDLLLPQGPDRLDELRERPLRVGWSYFLKGDVRRGMGIFHTLDGPDWRLLPPDTYLLEATVFMNTCHFDFAHEALKRIEEKYLSLKRKPLQKFLSRVRSPESLYRAFVLGQTNKGIELPRLTAHGDAGRRRVQRALRLGDATVPPRGGALSSRRRDTLGPSSRRPLLVRREQQKDGTLAWASRSASCSSAR